MKQAIGFIPLRKGSKGIPGKNKKLLAGKPLFKWILDEAVESNLERVYVYTDDDDIIYSINNDYKTTKVEVLRRSKESATDTASTEFAMLEFAKTINFNFEVFCLLQATSPLTTAQDINTSLLKMQSNTVDSLVSVVRTHRFIWGEDGKPQNYDIYERPRRQDFKGLLIENGAIYCTKVNAIKTSKNRISGKIDLVEMQEDTLVEIDSLTDWAIIEQLLLTKNNNIKL